MNQVPALTSQEIAAEPPAPDGWPWPKLSPVSFADQKILVLDDEETVVDVVRNFLLGVGYEQIVGITDSTKAMETIRSEKPDLIITDIVMPKVSGVAILHQVREDPVLCHTPIIVLTSITDRNFKVKALDGGATEFLTKPMDAVELLTRVRNVLAAKAYQDYLRDYVSALEKHIAHVGALQRQIGQPTGQNKA